MQQHTSTTADARVQVGSLWIDRAHHHRLVEVIHVPDEDHVRLRPVRESHHQPPSYLEDGRATRKRLRAGAAMTTLDPAERGARRSRARARDPTRPRRQGQGGRQPPARRGDPRGARPPAREGCRCPITPDSTLEDLLALGAGCTAGRWVCPTLDAIRRRLGR